MIRVESVALIEQYGAGCNNGVLNTFQAFLSNGKNYIGNTCRCGRGCHNAERLPLAHMEFENEDAFFEYLES